MAHYMKISELNPTTGQSLFHVGVIMAAIRLLERLRKEGGGRHFTQEAALAALRDAMVLQPSMFS